MKTFTMGRAGAASFGPACRQLGIKEMQRDVAAQRAQGVNVAKNKTVASAASPDACIAAIEDDARRSDCAALMALMAGATKLPPVMWGTAIVGFGVHRYALAGGKTGAICAVGFSSRKG